MSPLAVLPLLLFVWLVVGGVVALSLSRWFRFNRGAE
jgi:hypothetical protein